MVQAAHPGDLELAAGDVITCYDKADADWLHGTSQLTGETGLFPANHVHLHPVGMSKCKFFWGFTYRVIYRGFKTWVEF